MNGIATSIDTYRQVWATALALRPAPANNGSGAAGQIDTWLRAEIVAELAAYLNQPVEWVESRCRTAAAELAQAWCEAAPATAADVAAFYRQADAYLYDLTWWHTLSEDDSALIQVEALETALAYRARSALDFGSGIGSLGLLMARHGLSMTLAEINPRLNDYARWRFDRRGLKAQFLDLPASGALTDVSLVRESFDLISAVDVFEHLPDPRAALAALSAALRPGGALFIHLPSAPDPARPMHLWHNPAVLLRHLAPAGLWLERASGSTLILRRGEGPHYTLNRGLDLLPDDPGGILLSPRPLVALRLNPQAFGLLASLNGGSTAAELAAARPGLPLADVTTFLDDLARRRLLIKRPPPSVRWPAVSIIAPARGRPIETRACVESLLALDYPADRLELIVVDDASDPPLAPALAGLPVRLMRQDVNIGQSAARNRAAAAARGELLAFIDNDCVAAPGWLRTLVAALDDPAVAVAGGRVIAPPGAGRVAAFEAVRSPLDMGAFGGEVGPGEAVAYMPACNLVVRRDVLLQISGFDAAMALGEDVDVIWRARRAGGRARYLPEGTVVHHHRVRLGALLRRRADYGSSEADLQRRHPEGRRVMALPIAVIALLAALVTWSVSWLAGLALMLVALASVIGELGQKFRQLRRAGVRLPAGQVIAAVLLEHQAALYHLGANVTRYYSLPLLVTGLLWPRLLLAAGILFLAPPVIDHRRLRPDLSLPAFIGLYWLELGAYQIGVWRGCLKWRTLRPLLPILRLGR